MIEAFSKSLELPCGAVLRNRSAKAAMSEDRVSLNRAKLGQISDAELQSMQVGARIAYFDNRIRRLGDGLNPDTDIHRNEILARRERLEEQSNDSYRRATAAQ